MKLSRRTVLRNLSLLGATSALLGCNSPDAAPLSAPAGQAAQPPPAGIQSPIRLTIEGLSLLKPQKNGQSVSRVDVALLVPPDRNDLRLPKHHPVLRVPVQLLGEYTAEPFTVEPGYAVFSLEDTDLDTVVKANGRTYSSFQNGTGVIGWNDTPDGDTLLECRDNQNFRGLGWIPHMSEFSEQLKRDWNDDDYAEARIGLVYGNFEPAGLPLSAQERGDITAWIFRRTADNKSKWENPPGTAQARVVKNTVTATLVDFEDIRFYFGGPDGKYIQIRKTPRQPRRFDAERDPIQISNLAKPMWHTQLHDFRAYYDLSEPAANTSTPMGMRFFPFQELACGAFRTIECGCCPPAIG
jgi:hypothetical protein